MSKTRWSILTILVLSAAGLASAQTPQESQPPTPDKHAGMQRESADQQLQMLSEKLNLTDDQKTKLKPILQDQMQQMKAVHEDGSLSPEQKKAKMKSIHESIHDQINAVLTPEQQTKFKQMQQEHMGKPKG